MPEERIRDYSIESLIGRGGMGSVYLASHVHLGTPAALKVLLEQYSEDTSIKERFINEARLLHTLHHPNIVLQKEFFEENGRLVLVMEYVDGRGLDRMIGQEVGPIPWEKALPLFGQVLSGVGYAHSRGVVHRDIKPANILVSAAGEVKITDFGIAKIAGQKGMTRTGAQMGTLYYESPEQIRGARDVDHRADIYALGMTLYEMLAGRLPFDEAGDTSEFQVMNTIVNRQAHLDPREYYPHIPEWLVGVVQKATELEPDSRYESCDAFLRALEQGGKLSTGEHGYWSVKVASVSAIKPITTSAALATPASASPESSCPKCGTPVEKEMEFCGECGADLQQECPGCKKRIRWYLKHCPKCGVNIGKKKVELAAETERKRHEEARLREEARIAEEKRKAEEAHLREEARIAEEQRKTEEARVAREREEERQHRREAAEALRLRRKQWWKRNGWKVAVGLVLVGSGTGYVGYRNSDLYEYHQAEGLYSSGDLAGAASAFSALGNYRDSQDRSNAIRYEIAEGLYASGDVSGAYSAFRALGGYRDSSNRASSLRFVKEGDFITDHDTGLQWRVGPDRNTDWNAANTWVNGLGGGWRMPTRAELRGLWDAGISSDNWGPFENSGVWVWSGEVRDSSSAWYFLFYDGIDNYYTRGLSNYGARAFAVRPRG